jgi:hypothetical protein
MRIYYEDRKTGSIYSIDEFAKLIVSQGMNTNARSYGATIGCPTA